MRLTLQLHPDRVARPGGRTVLGAIADSGVYLSQFVTGTSNGGLTAHPGGDRWRWESRLFAGRYDDAPAGDRPVYGAWNRRDDPWGGAPRFGSSYLVLSPACAERATYCFPDSALEPALVGGPERLPELCAAAEREGLDGLDALDDYVEAQVHGGVEVATDVAEVVLDPCFTDTPVHRDALALGPPVSFHPGFRLATADLGEQHDDYRGPEAVRLARSLGEVLTPGVVTGALRDHPAPAVKHVWHLLARFGRDPGRVPGRTSGE